MDQSSVRILMLLAFTLAGLAQTPAITLVSNAALPSLDSHVPAYLQPRSIASLFGSNLADSAVPTSPPWKKTLGGVEVHLVPLATPCSSTNPPSTLTCEFVTDLLYVSPTQINLVVPDTSPAAYGQQALWLNIVLIRNGVRTDTHVTFYVSTRGDFALFQAGYDCDFSGSVAHPENCGYSASPTGRVPIGAVTDASGSLITSQNPIHQGQPIILWATGLGALNLNSGSGLLQQNNPTPITFGVLQPNPGDVGYSIFNLNWKSLTPLFAGESPQYVGLDQINLSFPICSGSRAPTEQRYDLVLSFRSPVADANLGIGFASLYEPFIINPGDPTCQFGAGVVLTSNPNPSVSGQIVTFTAVSSSSLPGSVTFLDGTVPLASKPLAPCGSIQASCAGSETAFVTSSLAPGLHPMTASYSGTNPYDQSTSTTLVQAVTVVPTIAVSSSSNPSILGQAVTITATVSPSTCTGTVSFFEASNQSLALGNGTLANGKAAFATSSLSVGSHPITGIYGGDTNCSKANAPTLTQTVNPAVKPNATILITSNINPSVAGQSVTFAVAVSPSTASGVVSVSDGSKGTLITNLPLSAGRATVAAPNLSVGTHSITASYSGDSNYAAGTSNVLIQTVNEQ